MAEWQRVTIANLYAVDLPTTFEMGFDMHEYAQLQYYDLEHSIFLLGIEDAKENLGDIKRRRLKLRGYFTFVEDIVMEAADTSLIEASAQMSLPGTEQRPARFCDYWVGQYEGTDIPLFYRIAVYESPDYFFQLVFWMPYENHCQYYPTIEKISQSFTLLPGAMGDQKLTPSLTGQ